MKNVTRIIVVLIMSLFAHNVWALTIVSPKEGEIVHAGSELTIVVEPAPGEKWETVLLGIYPMSYDLIKNEYSYTLTIPKNLSGYITDTIVIAADGTGKVVELKRNFFVKHPSNVVLQSIVVDPNPLFLEKLPPESDPKDMQLYESRQLGVGGMYSDGVERWITPSADGTNYTSSDETIVKVDKEGKVTAQGIGKAKITVRNDNISVDVRVIVDPYKK